MYFAFRLTPEVLLLPLRFHELICSSWGSVKRHYYFAKRVAAG